MDERLIEKTLSRLSAFFLKADNHMKITLAPMKNQKAFCKGSVWYKGHVDVVCLPTIEKSIADADPSNTLIPCL